MLQQGVYEPSPGVAAALAERPRPKRRLLALGPLLPAFQPKSEPRWRELLYGVSAGGCGTIIASLANLLAWRIYVRESNRDRKFFGRLTAINFVFLIWAGAGGWWLLSFRA